MGPHSCHLSESGFSGQVLRILIHKNRQRSRPNLSQTKILDPSCIGTSRANPIQISYFVNQKTSDLKKRAVSASRTALPILKNWLGLPGIEHVAKGSRNARTIKFRPKVNGFSQYVNSGTFFFSWQEKPTPGSTIRKARQPLPTGRR